MWKCCSETVGRLIVAKYLKLHKLVLRLILNGHKQNEIKMQTEMKQQRQQSEWIEMYTRKFEWKLPQWQHGNDKNTKKSPLTGVHWKIQWIYFEMRTLLSSLRRTWNIQKECLCHEMRLINDDSLLAVSFIRLPFFISLLLFPFFLFQTFLYREKLANNFRTKIIRWDLLFECAFCFLPLQLKLVAKTRSSETSSLTKSKFQFGFLFPFAFSCSTLILF